MNVKVFVALCGLAFVFFKVVSSQPFSSCLDVPFPGYQPAYIPAISPLAYNVPYIENEIVYANLNNLDVFSGSPIPPGTISVKADNLVVEGTVNVGGSLPVFGSVVVDGALPTGGIGAVVYNAGNGVGLTSVGCGISPPVVGTTVVSNAGLIPSVVAPVLPQPAVVSEQIVLRRY